MRAALLMLALMAGPALAGSCLQAPWREQPCPNLRYLSVMGERGARMLCVCAPDFDHLQVVPDTVAGKTLRARELERIANSYQLTQSELQQLLKLAD